MDAQSDGDLAKTSAIFSLFEPVGLDPVSTTFIKVLLHVPRENAFHFLPANDRWPVNLPIVGKNVKGLDN